ncbi:MAG TPA: GtrA family protein [Candidatus Binatia bacterium]
MNIIDQLVSADTGNLVQFVKYVLSGTVATAAHILVFHLAAWKMFFALQPDDWFLRLFSLRVEELEDATRSRNSMKANGVAFVISNFVAYILNVTWVFVPGRHHWLVEIGLFYLVSGLAIAIGTGLMGLLIRRFGLLTTYAFGANLVAALMINYAARKFFIFSG